MARNAKPKNKPNKKKFQNELDFLKFKRTVIERVQNNKSNKSVEIKKEDTLAAGITKKLIAHNHDLFLDNDKELQSL